MVILYYVTKNTYICIDEYVRGRYYSILSYAATIQGCTLDVDELSVADGALAGVDGSGGLRCYHSLRPAADGPTAVVILWERLLRLTGLQLS